MTDIPHPTSVGTTGAESVRYATPMQEGVLELESDGTNIDLGVSGAQFAKEKRGKLGPTFWFCVGWICVNAFIALFAPVLPLQDPNYHDFLNFNANPSAAHWFGTDSTGTDLFSQVMWGLRNSIFIGLSTMILAYAIGATLGMFAAYRRGRLDTTSSAGMFVFQAFPGLVLIIAITQFWAPITPVKLIISIAFVAVPLVFRVIRASTISAATREYIISAKMQGARDSRILARELLPNIFPTALSFFLIGIALVIALEGALSFLGLSVPNTISLGSLINQASETPGNFWLMFFPTVALCMFLLTLNFVGDRLRSYFDVTEVKL